MTTALPTGLVPALELARAVHDFEQELRVLIDAGCDRVAFTVIVPAAYGGLASLYVHAEDEKRGREEEGASIGS